MSYSALTKFAWLSIGAALATIGLKTAAFFVTDSVGLLSDALESLVNLAGAIMALAMLTIAARPADSDHTYGHGKAEYFSSGAEGALIIAAAGSIAVAAIGRLANPQPLQQIGLGLIICGGAALINLVVALVLLQVGRKNNSITLEANAHHLLTDVWTSIGVIAGVGAVSVTGWLWLDPVLALAVAANITRSGFLIVRRSVLGLMDTALPGEDLQAIKGIWDRYQAEGVQFHALRTRQSGVRRFVSMHVLVPGDWTVQRGHELLEKIENDIRQALPRTTVFTHLEPIDDPVSWDDATLERSAGEKPAPHNSSNPHPGS
jgi:cation diffusion facilitator family transporter